MSSPGRHGPQLPYRSLAGVVPCPDGWLVATGKLVGVTLHADAINIVPAFREVLDRVPGFSVIAVGAPIGLYDEAVPGGRSCDIEARRLLGWPRLGAITSPPGRRELAKGRRVRVKGARRRLLDRVAELDAEMEPYRQRAVYAAHPELSFWSLNDQRPLQHGKHTEEGIRERDVLVRRRVHGAQRLIDPDVQGAPLPLLLDAVIVLWTARRIEGRSALRVPADPEWDGRGLRAQWTA